MPDLSALPPLIPGLLATLLASKAEHLTERERLYYRVYLRLVDKAVSEYGLARHAVLRDVAEWNASPKGNNRGRTLHIVAFMDHIENCINASRRLYALLDRVKAEDGGLTIERVKRRAVEAHFDELTNVRDAIEHVDDEIRGGEVKEGIMPSFTDNDQSLKMLGYTMRFCDLAAVLTKFNEIGRDWMAAFVPPKTGTT
jgi:hypothetical protein